MNERAWWGFQMPCSLVYVPAESEAEARGVLAHHCYQGAPVGSFALVRTRVGTREAIAGLGRRAFRTEVM